MSKKLVGNISELNLPPLHSKQSAVLMSPASILMFGGSLGGGKDLCLDTPILTINGFKRMEDIHPGDYVFDDKGVPTKVIAESDVFTGKDVYEVCFDDGTSIFASSTHQWVTQTVRERESNRKRTEEFRATRRAKRPSRSTGKKPWLAKKNSEREYVYDSTIKCGIRTTEEIAKTLIYKNTTNHSIVNTEPLEFLTSDLPVHPYVLGAWLGDGTRGCSGFTSADPEIIEYIRNLGYTVTKQKSRKYGYNISMLFADLKVLGVSSEKSIPDIYKYSSIEDRRDLVRGLMDTDGTVDKDGGISIGLSDKPLFDDLVFVLQSLGIKVFTNVKKTYLNGERKRDSYIASFSPNFRCFNLSRKVGRLRSKTRSNAFCRYIKDVRLVSSRSTKCIQVEADSHMFLAGEQLVPTHNSFLIRYLSILYAAIVPGIQIYIVRRLIGEMEKNHMRGDTSIPMLLAPWIQAGLVSIKNSAPYEVRFHNNSRIFLDHMQYEKDVTSWQGRELHCLSGDTKVHTDGGVFPISKLVGTTGKVKTIGGTSNYHTCRIYRKDAIFRYTFSNGAYVDCTDDHGVYTSINNKLEIETAYQYEFPVICGGDNSFQKIKSKEYLRTDDTYCLTVENTHCFYVNDNILVSNCVFIDESTNLTEYQLRYLMTRLRLGSFRIDYEALKAAFDNIYASWGIDHRISMREVKTYFPRAIFCTNPGGVSHLFHKETFVDPAPPMQIFKSEFGNWAQYIPSLYTDNPTLLEEDPNYIQRIEGLGDEDMVAALKEGRWDILSGAALGGVWDPAIHVIEPFDIPETWYVDVTFDWGYTKPASAGIWACSNGDDAKAKDGSILSYPKGTLFRIAEVYLCDPKKKNTGLQLSDYEMGERIAEKVHALGIDPYYLKPGPADNTIFSDKNYRGTISSPHDELLNGFNAYMENVGKRKKGCLFIESDKSPGSRIRGLSVLRNYLKASMRKPMEDKGLFIFETCRDFIRTVPVIPRGDKNPEDVNTDAEDHIYDEVRYKLLSQNIEVHKLSNYL